MLPLAAIALTCWLCVLLAIPRKPLPGNDIAELVYRRLLGCQQRLLLLALIATAIALVGAVAALPERVDPNLQSLRGARASCTYPLIGGPICPVLEPGGVWAQAQGQADGSWRVLPARTVAALNPHGDPAARKRSANVP
jgi:hypothetical protein